VARNLKVVFQSDVRGIAQAGDVKMVSPGYARNYLFPRDLAFPATDAALKQWETVRQGTLAKAQRRRETAQAQAQQIEALSVTMTAKASPEGKLFGSVGRQDIREALKAQGVTVEKGAIQLTKPIKQVGSSVLKVQLSSGVQANLTVNVTAAN
jgi:large subunit ribosomal protein L9